MCLFGKTATLRSKRPAMPSTGDLLLRHFETLDATPLPPLPNNVEWLNPLRTYPETSLVFKAFLDKYYHDDRPRTLILGINPGRFGGGITNVAFTDPVLLEQVCGIPNSFEKRAELSAQFVYRVIDAYGGPAAFYQRFYINSICPLGFVKGGKNYNYYDEKPLQTAVLPLIRQHLEGLLRDCRADQTRCICLGEGQNFAFFQKLNAAEGYFKEVIPVPHPRFVMQYRRKLVEDYVGRYLEVLGI